MRAFLNLRYTEDRRAVMFRKGLKRLGYKIEACIPTSMKPGDIFLTWNRIGQADTAAKHAMKSGNVVLVTENASWGNSFAGQHWYHIARTYHNTAGMVPYGGPDRFNALDVDLQPWRTSGETIILPQRGIGSAPVRMPKTFLSTALKQHGGRVRKHPGKRPARPLEEDLARAGLVVTWGSGAAIKALMMGVPVISYIPNWIGEQDNTDAGRLAMLQQLAWAQWTHQEISSGEAFKTLLEPVS